MRSASNGVRSGGVKQIVQWSVLGLVCVLLLALRLPLPPSIGAIDFRAYWSAGYLLQHGENFADPSRLFQVERDLTMWSEGYPMITWNPPWLLPLLIPYTWVSFARAAWWWLLTNIALVFGSAVVLWQLSASSDRTRRLTWLAPLIAFAYSPTLVALVAGQVNLIVLAGLAAFLFFRDRHQDARAGVSLALTLVKFHLDYLTLAIVLLDDLRMRRWRALAGFFGTLLVLTAIVFVLRPSFLLDYAATIGGGGLLDYQTPTLGAVLAALAGWNGFKLIGIAILPLVIVVWWRAGSRWDFRTWIDATLIVSVITAPFGWSYDFVVLLVPLSRVMVWIAERKFKRADALAIVVSLLIVDGLMYYQRVVGSLESSFFWVPLVLAAVYAYAWARRSETAYA